MDKHILEAALRKACEHIADCSGSCPLDQFEWDDCLMDDCDNNAVECYIAYFSGTKRVLEWS